jgi:hypothetical protein
MTRAWVDNLPRGGIYIVQSLRQLTLYYNKVHARGELLAIAVQKVD